MEWILITERLPPKKEGSSISDLVIVSDIKSTWVAWLVYALNGNAKGFVGDDWTEPLDSTRIIAWQPMPDPIKITSTNEG